MANGFYIVAELPPIQIFLGMLAGGRCVLNEELAWLSLV